MGKLELMILIDFEKNLNIINALYIGKLSVQVQKNDVNT